LKELRERVLRGKYRIPFYMSTECEQLLKRFMVLVPSKRISLRRCMGEQWINMQSEDLIPHTNEAVDLEDEARHARMKLWGFNAESVHDNLEANTCNHEAAMYYLLGRANLPPLDAAPASDTVFSASGPAAGQAATPRRRQSVAAVPSGGAKAADGGGGDGAAVAEVLPRLHRTNTFGGGDGAPKSSTPAPNKAKLVRRHTEAGGRGDDSGAAATGVPVASLRTRTRQNGLEDRKVSRTRCETEPADPHHAARGVSALVLQICYPPVCRPSPQAQVLLVI